MTALLSVASWRVERRRRIVRTAVLAIALMLLFALTVTSLPLPETPGNPGSLLGAAPSGTAPGYAPEATAFIYPVGAPRVAPTSDPNGPNGYDIEQMFDGSCDATLKQGFYNAGQYFCGHSGVDLTNGSAGGPVHATANGVVVEAGDEGTMGEMARIQHLLPDGTYAYSRYEHMRAGSLRVATGQVVALGQVIGRVGDTGFAVGAHLHFEIKGVNTDGVGYAFGNKALLAGYDDPIAFIAAHAATPTAQGAADPTTLSGSDLTTATVTLAANGGAATVSVAAPMTATPSPTVTAPVTRTTPTTVALSPGGEQRGALDEFARRYRDYVTVSSAAVGLNVRAGSGFDAAPLTSVAAGARLGYLGMTGNGWVRVALPGNVIGYVARQWVEGPALPALPPAAAPAPYTAPFLAVLDARYPARVGPTMRAAPVEPMQVGEKVAFLMVSPTSPSWDRVVLPSGRAAWVLNWYVTRPPIGAGVTPHAIPARATHDRAPTAVRAAVTTADNVNLRAGPRLAAPVVAALPVGTRLSVRGYHISWADVAYVLRTYVAPVGAAALAARASHTPTPRLPRGHSGAHAPRPHVVAPVIASSSRRLVVIASEGANLRAAPTRTATVRGAAPRDTPLTAVTTRGAWVEVRTPDGATAWIMRDLTRAA